MSDIQFEQQGSVGFITLARPRALNALSLPMIRDITAALRLWLDDPAVLVVAMRGSDKQGAFGNFCAGGDIRFFHTAALAGDTQLEDFFTEEYRLNHLLHRYSKPVIAFLDGIVMGGGMGLAQGASVRLVTQRTRMAMPETGIGLFPDVGGGYFLSRCPGRVGEYLAMAGNSFGAHEALQWGLADRLVSADLQAAIWQRLSEARAGNGVSLVDEVLQSLAPVSALPAPQSWTGECDRHFALGSVQEILHSLQSESSEWAQASVTTLLGRSPLMVHVALEQVRRARQMPLDAALRMERDMVRHCFHPVHLQRSAAQSETVEGIRALAVDKDQTPRWSPTNLDSVTQDMVDGFFVSPWPELSHPLRDLQGDGRAVHRTDSARP